MNNMPLKSVYLLSYPRSGNTWVRYIVEYLTKFPTLGVKTKRTKKSHVENGISTVLDLGVDFSKPIIMYKRHVLVPNDYKMPGVLPLIVLVRNYKETMFRGGIWNKETESIKYCNVLNKFHNWNNRKLLIYYEDLILAPEYYIQKILDFICVDVRKNDVIQFCNQLETHRQKSINIYEKSVSKSLTKGEMKIYHSKGRTKEVLDWVDNRIENTIGKELYDLYLKRYDTR